MNLKGGETKTIFNTLDLVKHFFITNEVVVEIRNKDNDIKAQLTYNLENNTQEKPFKLENTLEEDINKPLNMPFTLDKNIENIIHSIKIDSENKRINEIVKNMIKENLDISLISKITYLTMEEIENLK